MSKRVITAREQLDLLSPWMIREAADQLAPGQVAPGKPAQPASYTQPTKFPVPAGAIPPSATSQPARPFGPASGIPTWGPGGVHNPYNTGSGGPGPAAGGGGTPSGGGSSGGGGGHYNGPYNPSAGEAQWKPQIEEALRRNNMPVTPENVNAVMYQIHTESSGNPNAINNDDINAIQGHPSQGLLQTIPSTFNQYHLPGDSSNITDPQANLDAAINYHKQVYGPEFAQPGGKGIGSGTGY